MAFKNTNSKSKKRLIFILPFFFILILIYLFKFISDDSISSLPEFTRIETKKKELHRLYKKLKKVKQASEDKQKKKDYLKLISSDFWLTQGKIPASQVKFKLEKTARKARVQMRTIGAARTVDASQNIKKVEISVSLNATMKDISRFLKEVDLLRPRYFWDNCSIRPDRLRNPRGVLLNGKLISFVLTKSTSDFILNKELKKKKEKRRKGFFIKK